MLRSLALHSITPAKILAAPCQDRLGDDRCADCLFCLNFDERSTIYQCGTRVVFLPYDRRFIESVV